ncbi:hypothetical protein LSH36_372g02010 [Paralvinella palmiformis]|uniref:Uncharacterized protein n=1 Tax=Paralvinella palmiformis TaxID=53620 RepID=A0AAD9JE06_9ANNE|nr:hypothetical protein LSH36_372g02010 [Paralvinella palmiformis]
MKHISLLGARSPPDVALRKVVNRWRPLCHTEFVVVVAGSMYVHQCGGSKFIPIYMMVAGIIGLIQFLIMLYSCCVPVTPTRTMTKKHTVYNCQNVFFGFFMGWTFFGK